MPPALRAPSFFLCTALVVSSLASCERAAKSPPTETRAAPAGSPSAAPGAKKPSTDRPGDKIGEAVASSTLSAALRNMPPRVSAAPRWGEGAPAAGVYGVVTSVEDSATRAGVLILEKGGNAVDAAVAVGLALAVTHPSAGNLGGGGFMLVRLGSRAEAIDFREDSPRGLTEAKFWSMIKKGGRGPVSVGVPGTVKGLYLAHQRHGRLPWRDVVTPALELAEKGFLVGKRQARTFEWSLADLKTDPGALAELVPGGLVPGAGSTMLRPGLAIALRRIRDEGPAGFYQGDTARDLIASLGSSGVMTLEDLELYEARVRDPLHFDFGGYRVITMPAPSAGGVALTQSLLMMAKLDVSRTKPESPARFHLMAEVGRRAQAERQLFVVAPETLSAEQQAESTRRTLDPSTWLRPFPIDPQRASRSSALDPRFPALERELDHTTHASVIDAEGGLVSLTVTLSGSFGARVVTRKTGIVLNNSAASFSSAGMNVPRPGVRTTSSMAPTLVLGGDDHALVLGSPGGNTIPSTLMRLFLALVVDRVSLTEAVARPRIHQTFAPGDLLMEPAQPLPKALQHDLRGLGHSIKSARSAIGDANIAARIGDQAFAIADSREGGLAAAAGPPKASKGDPSP